MATAARRRELWRLALNLSVTAAVGGLLLLAAGAIAAAWITFGLGALCAGAAGLLIRRSNHRARLPR
jgi:hypothetical protein